MENFHYLIQLFSESDKRSVKLEKSEQADGGLELADRGLELTYGRKKLADSWWIRAGRWWIELADGG